MPTVTFRQPPAAAAATASAVSGILTPPSEIEPFVPSGASSRFIAGEPMNAATIVLAGLS
jgi:hypothetical protein